MLNLTVIWFLLNLTKMLLKNNKLFEEIDCLAIGTKALDNKVQNQTVVEDEPTAETENYCC